MASRHGSVAFSDPLSDASELCRLDAAALASAYAARTLSPVEVAKATLARAHQVHERFNAFVRIDETGSLAAAAAAEARWRAGTQLSPVDGIPTTIKDIVWVAGTPIHYGSRAAEPVVAAQDAPAVARLRAAGCVIVGITTTPEFGWKALTDSPAFGITRNPFDPGLTSGGSSGGAAVAAATGAGVFHLGSDGGGSIRVPSSFCGIAGHKPTFGRVPAYPPSAFGTLAHVGPMARTAADVSAMLRVMSGHDARDWYQAPGVLPSLDVSAIAIGGKRIGYWRAPPVGAVDPEVAAIIEAAVGLLRVDGAIVEPVELPAEDLHGLFQTLWFTGAAARLAAVDPARRADVDPALLDIAAAGARVPAIDLVRAGQRRAEFGKAMDALLTQHDVLVSPAVAVPPFEAGRETPEGSGLARWTEWAGFSFPINLSQQPACVIPCGRTATGRPVGLQVVGARGQDAEVLAVAAAIERLLMSKPIGAGSFAPQPEGKVHHA